MELKSPLGIMPRSIWEEKCRNERLSAMLAAISRFTEAQQPIPHEWTQELWDLVNAVTKR